MAKKTTPKVTPKAAPKTKVIKEKDNIIFFKCTEKVTEKQYKLLGDMVRHENAKSGCKIVLVPYSCEVE